MDFTSPIRIVKILHGANAEQRLTIPRRKEIDALDAASRDTSKTCALPGGVTSWHLS